MTSKSRRCVKRKILLTYSDVDQILYHMGWEPIDVDVFWSMALERKLEI